MKQGDTIDVALHVRIADKEPLHNGDQEVTAILVCDGKDIGALSITIFGNPTEESKRELVRGAALQCLAGAIGVVDDIASGAVKIVEGEHPIESGVIVTSDGNPSDMN